MNIFIIPSWYPDDRNPVGGIFIEEQAEALAKIYPEHNFIVSHCGNFYLSLSSYPKTYRALRDFFKSKSFEKNIKNNLTEFYEPVLTWTEKLGGEIRNIIGAHTSNFLKAQDRFGKIDIVHAHVSYPGGYSAMKIKEQFSVPYVITEHMGPFPFVNFLENGILSQKLAEPLNKADEIIAVSSFLADQIKSFGIREPVVIPNMVNENLFFPDSSVKKNKPIKFLTVSSFIESKGIKELLDGILLSVNGSEQKEFVIAGSGPLENYIREFIDRNNLTQTVTLINNPVRDSVIRLFHECDVFILPSHIESFGIVYVEAMACGKPVIATDCGGPADFVNQSNGRLIPVENVDSISDAIEYFSINLSDYSSEKIREFFTGNYSGQAVCPKIISTYEKLLQK